MIYLHENNFFKGVMSFTEILEKKIIKIQGKAESVPTNNLYHYVEGNLANSTKQLERPNVFPKHFIQEKMKIFSNHARTQPRKITYSEN